MSDPQMGTEIQAKRITKPFGRHNHGPNFGRYVAECPGCIEACPGGPPQSGYVGKKPRNRISAERLAVQTKETIEQTKGELEQRAALLIEQLEAASKRAAAAEAAAVVKLDPMSELVQMMMRREASAMKKEEDTEARRLAAREDMLRITQEQEAQRLARQANCNHLKDNGRSAINGQVHNDGFYHPICFHCFKEFSPVRPNSEQMSNGMQTV